MRPAPSRILLASDGSAQSAKAASVLAAIISPGAVVRLITVASLGFSSSEGQWGPLSDEPERTARLHRAVEQAFREPLMSLGRTDCKIEQSSRLGNPPEEIMNEINDWKPDLVVVGRTGLGGLAGFVLGSVSEYLVKHAHVPVLVVP